MAAGGGLTMNPPPGGAPTVPLAPLLPIGADPGPITEWLLDNTSTETSSDIAREMERGFNRLVNNIPDVGAAGHAEAMQAMKGEIIGCDAPTIYLTATNLVNNVAKVTTVHSIHQYSAGFGRSNPLHGNILGLMGEMLDAQLPTLVRFDDDPDEDLTHALLMERVVVPSDAMIDAYFTAPGAATVMPAVIEADGGTGINVSNIFPIALAWAPYFMQLQSPYEAFKKGQALIATLNDVTERARADPLLNWLRAACTQFGDSAVDSRLCLVNQKFHLTAPDVTVLRWMRAKINIYQKEEVPRGVTFPVGLPPTLPRCSIDARGEKTFSPLETSKILACCGITSGQWETHVPEIYPKMLEEGRTTSKVRSLLEEVFKPGDTFTFDSIDITVTDDLAKDVKELNLGFNNDLSYETSHRGVSPFSVIGISLAMASRRRRIADRLTRTTHATLADVTEAETTPDPIPMEYHALTSLLRSYVELLKHLVGERCDHYLQVRSITAILIAKRRSFENLAAQQIASLLWIIFTDARSFFSAGVDVRGNLPQSFLSRVSDDMAMGIVMVHHHVPFAELLGRGGGEGPPGIKHQSNEEGRGAVSPSKEARKSLKIYKYVVPTIKTSLTGARSKYPTLTISDLMAATSPPLQYSQVRIGSAGACLDYLCFGLCKDTKCGYKHSEIEVVVRADRAKSVAKCLGAAYSTYDAAQPTQ
jgi:hypothetical protein